MLRPRPLTRILLTVLLGGATVLNATAQNASPFKRAEGSAASASQAQAGPATPAEFVYTGAVSMGDQQLICITATATQRSHWIKVGQTLNGITVVSHRSETKEVVIRRAGQEMTLPMVERSFDASQLQAYQPVPIAQAPVAQAGLAERVALTNEEKATEARMLVSDLLEIGIIQRKAYEKAREDQAQQQKEASQAALDSRN